MHAGWNKGLTKETDSRVAKYAKSSAEAHKKRFAKRAKQMGDFTEEEKQILYGSLLGDGCITINKNAMHAHYIETHCSSQIPYVVWKHKKLQQKGMHIHYYPDNPHYQVVLGSVNSVQYTNLHHLFYPNGVKIIPQPVLDTLTPLGIAVWFMDDGTKSNKGFKIATCSFTVDDVAKAADMFDTKYDIRCKQLFARAKIKKYPMISFGKADAQKLQRLIDPYIIGEMRYKLWN